MGRNLVTQSIKRFKGINRFQSLTSLGPEFAQDCVNVIPSTSGALEKLRYPVTLSEEITGKGEGPDQFAMYENVTDKQVLAFFGQDIYLYTLDDFAAFAVDTNPDYLGPVPWSVVVSNNFAFLQNGQSNPLKWNGTDFDLWGIQQGGIPTLGAKAAGAITLITGRKYRVAYKNNLTDDVGTASDISASTGPMVTQQQSVTIPAPSPADTQINVARVYATLDGGADYFFHSEQSGPFPIVFSDNTPDTGLDQAERAPLINDVPPKAYYLAKWGTRMFMFRLPDEPNGHQSIAYTGYNRIFVGRPENTCPRGNRLKLETGADVLAGGGVIDQGIVAFDRSNKMFMYRGQPEDITYTAPVEFTLFLRELPWNIGCASHFTIVSTPHGLAWLTPDLDVMMFDGTNKPVSLAFGLEPILKTTTISQIFNCRAVHWMRAERDWYVLAIPTGNSGDLTKLLIFDLEENPERNGGSFVFDIGEFQSLAIVNMLGGDSNLVIGQDGLLKALTVASETLNGISDITSTDSTLGAYWRSGYFGNEAPQHQKMFRYGRLTADNSGFKVKRYIVQDNPRFPEIIEFESVAEGGKISTNRKGRLLSYEIRFPDEDVACAALELYNSYIVTAEK